ncbi:urease accessory protein UreE [Methylobacterium sp. Leaf93]|uniref:urease accessory protein UreE n=1 Tax=Methylobacterium sp. Leaf93 TaxID=1736249 RepID=UPI0006FA61F7|nr:urease accessory protein UreE [Methylobacterium sp. Leaf93]KQP03244.1 urease accessory protein UreE [Methylobacterium sp. Leaf93]
MLRATAIVRKAAIRPDAVADTVTLDHSGRQGAAAILTGAGGVSFTLALAKAASIEDGDAFRLEDGRLVTVRAAAESLLEVRAENPARLLRLAWQLGGNHVPAEIGADVLYVPATSANAELIRGQGCAATPVSRAFKPEREAHDHSQCSHDHAHDRGHDHSHAHDHGHAHDHADHGHANHGHAHVHGPDCKHDH